MLVHTIDSINLLMSKYPTLSTTLGIWLLGSITFMLRNAPIAIKNFLFRQLTTSLLISNSGQNFGNIKRYNDFNTWFIGKSFANFSRSLSLLDVTFQDDSKMTNVGMGTGLHAFRHNGRLYWLHKTRNPADSVTGMVLENIIVYTYGRSHQPLLDLVDAFVPQEDALHTKVFHYHMSNWDYMCSIPKQPLRTVVLNASIKSSIVKSLEDFIANEQWYLNRGKAWKRTIVFNGPPGSGKTSLIRCLAANFNLPIYLLDLNQMTSTTLQAAVRTIPPNSLLAIEDFDDNKAVMSRDKGLNESVASNTPSPLITRPQTVERLTLSAVLNAFDGIVPLHDIVTIMTTNNLANIDSAILRKGRVDDTYYLGALTHDEIVTYIKVMFGDDVVIPSVRFKDIMGCDISSIFGVHHNDYEAFLAQLPSHC